MAKVVNEETRRKILQGNVVRIVFAIIFPLFCYNIMNSLYTLIDSIMVAKINSDAVSAVSQIGQIKGLISSFGTGLAAGGGIIIARTYGAGDIPLARKNANILFSLGLLLSSLVLLICIPFAVPILKLCQVSDNLIAMSSGYFILQMVEQVFIVIVSIFISVEKSKGNTKIVFIINLIAMIIKISLNAIFIYGLGISNLIFVELSSLISQGLLLIIGLYYLFRKDNIFSIRLSLMKLEKKLVKDMILVSIPLFLGKFVINMGKVAVNAMCSAFYGDTIVGALAVSNHICGLITSGTTSMEDSVSSMVAQNVGNRNMKRSLKIFFTALTMACIWGTCGYILTRFVFTDEIVNLFNIKNSLKESATAGDLAIEIKKIFKYDSLSIIALMFNSPVLALLYGYGKTFMSSLINFFRIATRILTLLILYYLFNYGSDAAGISMAISNLFIASMSIGFLIYFLISTKIKGYKGMYFSDPEPEMVEVDGVLMAKSIAMEKALEL